MKKIIFGLILLISTSSFAKITVGELLEGEIYNVSEKTEVDLHCYDVKNDGVRIIKEIEVGPGSESILSGVFEVRLVRKYIEYFITGNAIAHFTLAPLTENTQISNCLIKYKPRSLIIDDDYPIQMLSKSLILY